MKNYSLTCNADDFHNYRMIDAVKRSRLKRFELCITQIPAAQNRALFEPWLKDGLLSFPSIHLSFYEACAFDETFRRNECAKLAGEIRDHSYTGTKNYTIHSGGQITSEAERRQCIVQLRKTLQELTPVAEEFDCCINVELLPRMAPVNNVKSLLDVVDGLNPERIGICFDVNHMMQDHRDIGTAIEALAGRIKTFHFSDYDGVDENHWIVGSGIIDWNAVMKAVKAVPGNPEIILETNDINKAPGWHYRKSDPGFRLEFAIRQIAFLENCESIMKMWENVRL